MVDTSVITVDTGVLAALSGLVLPILVGIVTKKVASRTLKATLLALFSAAAGVVAAAQGNGGVVSKETLLLALMAWVSAVATYTGIYKPAGVTETVQDKTADFGLG